MKTFFAIALSCVSSSVAGPIAAQDGLQRLAGCHAVRVGEWTPPAREATPSWRTLPPVIAFDTIRAGLDTPGPSWRAMRLIGGAPSPVPVRSLWAPVGSDSVLARISRGRVHVDVTLRVIGDSMRGRVTAFGDVFLPGEPPAWAPVTTIRTACPGAAHGGAGPS